jgi:hypothetical protein
VAKVENIILAEILIGLGILIGAALFGQRTQVVVVAPNTGGTGCGGTLLVGALGLVLLLAIVGGAVPAIP